MRGKVNPIPLAFAAACALAAWASGLDWAFLASELSMRLGRNLVLVLSLIIPVWAGLGLNFGIVLGAMAAQFALITAVHLGLSGFGGLMLTLLMATPVAAGMGYLVAAILNKAKGREMIASMITGFFADGVYQLILLFMVGTIIPIKNPNILLTSGIGVRNTIDLRGLGNVLDRLLSIDLGPVMVPVANLIFATLVAWGIVLLAKTKLGHDMIAVGQDSAVAELAGINVNSIRRTAVMMSTVLAAWGQIIFLQNMTTLNTYFSHDQVGMFSIAALLVGGATVSRANWGNALVGTLLFHTLFVVSPLAGQKLLASPQVGEFFRVFVAYAIIAGALAVNAWQKREVSRAKAQGAAVTGGGN